MNKKNIYFASDFHLGSPNMGESRKREKIIISWLDSIKNQAESIYLIGDIFDFWYEYQMVVPKGFVRFLSKLADLTEKGIRIHIIVGNHDLWMKDYLIQECGVEIHHNPIIITKNNKQIYIGHGDEIIQNNLYLKILNKTFRNKICQWMFSRIHPNTALKIAHSWSNYSRLKGGRTEYLGTKREYLEKFCINHKLKNPKISYYIFGHRHLPLDINITENCKYINTGDWINHYSFAVMEDKVISLKFFKKTS